MKVKELFESAIFFRELDLTTRNGRLVRNYSNDICEGELEIIDDNLRTLKGFPKEITNGYNGDELSFGNFYCTCMNLESLKDAPKIVKGRVHISNCKKINSLEGIGRDYFQEIGQSISIPPYVTSHILGTLKVKKLIKIDTIGHQDSKLREAIKIINSHLKSGRNINKCKSELIEAGLEEYAQL